MMTVQRIVESRVHHHFPKARVREVLGVHAGRSVVRNLKSKRVDALLVASLAAEHHGLLENLASLALQTAFVMMVVMLIVVVVTVMVVLALVTHPFFVCPQLHAGSPALLGPMQSEGESAHYYRARSKFVTLQLQAHVSQHSTEKPVHPG